jgi:hypothetical protein
MASPLPGLIIIALVAVPMTIARLITRSGIQEQIGASFVSQRVRSDGKELRSDDLQILYRSPATGKRDGLGGFSMLYAQWLCRTPDGSYLLAIATNSNNKDEGGVHWMWRPITEQQARALLLHKRKAYQLAFGEPPKK